MKRPRRSNGDHKLGHRSIDPDPATGLAALDEITLRRVTGPLDPDERRIASDIFRRWSRLVLLPPDHATG